MKTTVLLLVILIFGFSAQAQEISGGIIYSDGQNVIYHNFKTGQNENLTIDLNGPPIRGPLTISEDGLVLTWQQGNKLLARRLPDGDPYELTIMTLTGERENTKSTIAPIIVQKEIRNFTLSPEGTHFAFELTEKDTSFALVKPDRNQPLKPTLGGRYPKYTKKIEEYNAITIVSIGSWLMRQCGNTAFYPPVIPYRIDSRANNGRPFESTIDVLPYPPPPLYRGGPKATFEDAQKIFGVKRDAYFLTWQKFTKWRFPNRLFAVIYRVNNIWSVIEIRSTQPFGYDSPPTPDKLKDIKPGIWQIPVSLASCQGLAWKPDGSLTYLSAGNVFLLDNSQIAKGIDDSGVKHFDLDHYGNDNVVAVKYGLAIKPSLVASGINGDKLHWADNNTFVFRGKEGNERNIYSWRQGKIKKLCSAPEEFSYCDQLPILDGVVSGKSITPDITQDNDSRFFVGSIRLVWHGAGNIDTFTLGTGEIDGQKDLEFAFPIETTVEDIKDPSRYNYQRGKQPKPYQVSSNEYGKGMAVPTISGSLNQIVLLRLGAKYIAIKPLSYVHRFNSVEEMPKGWEGSWKEYRGKGPPPLYKTMAYEWKYWPASLANTLGKDENTKPLPDPSTTGKGEVLEKPADWSEEITPVEFYITMGDIKTNWQSGNNAGSPAFYLGPWEQRKIEYVIVQVNLESLVDPSRFKYTHYSGDHDVGISVVTGINQILLLKHSDEYVAIMPTAVVKKPKQLPPNLDPNMPQPSGNCLRYKWKYWPAPTGK